MFIFIVMTIYRYNIKLYMFLFMGIFEISLGNEYCEMNFFYSKSINKIYLLSKKNKNETM